jgi:drug/metabolite transporter (DMT)-like permease
MNRASAPPERRPAAWAVVLAFLIVYLTWGTTYFAIKEGVKTLPPSLFGGLRIGGAGVVLLAYLWLRGESLRLARRDLYVVAASGLLHFVGGNGLITFAEQTVDSGAAAVLAATSPLWIGLGEMLWPRGERLTPRGWVGVLIGLAGVLVLLAPNLRAPATLLADARPLLVLCSSICWSVGSLVLRHGRPSGSVMVSAAYQMALGGGALTLVGVLTGEVGWLTADSLTAAAVFSFFYLLVLSSLVAFVAYTWLLQHVSAPLVGTYAYVNPAVAVVVGWLLGDEAMTGWLLGGLVVILTGVAVVRGGGGARPPAARTADVASPDGAAYTSPNTWSSARR